MLNGNSTHLCPNWLKQHVVVVVFLNFFFTVFLQNSSDRIIPHFFYVLTCEQFVSVAPECRCSAGMVPLLLFVD